MSRAKHHFAISNPSTQFKWNLRALEYSPCSDYGTQYKDIRLCPHRIFFYKLLNILLWLLEPSIVIPITTWIFIQDIFRFSESPSIQSCVKAKIKSLWALIIYLTIQLLSAHDVLIIYTVVKCHSNHLQSYLKCSQILGRCQILEDLFSHFQFFSACNILEVLNFKTSLIQNIHQIFYFSANY